MVYTQIITQARLANRTDYLGTKLLECSYFSGLASLSNSIRLLPNFYLDIGYLGNTVDYVQVAHEQSILILQPYFEIAPLDPQVIEWEANFRRGIALNIIKEFELDTFVFLSEHFSCPVFTSVMDFLTMDYFWLQAWVELGVIRQQQLSDIEKERERKTQDIMDKRNELNAPSAFDKLASNIR